PGARLLLATNPLALAPGAATETRFEIAAQRFADAEEVNHFRIHVHASAAREDESFDETFLMPQERKTP
ncbi:MAG TPA: hypothetical protein VGF49_13165, partial [Candidatus Solibacter sp.]